jgi:hypothetical protein
MSVEVPTVSVSVTRTGSPPALAIERTSTLTSLAHAPMERERSSTAPSPAPLSRVSLAGAPSATAAMTTLEAPSVVQRVHDLGHGDRRAWAEQLGELADARDADEHSGGRGAVDDPDGAEHPRRGGQRRKDVEARLDAHPGTTRLARIVHGPA